MSDVLHVEDLLGRRVRAANGRVIGRLEELRADWRHGELEITAFLIGPGALLERLAAVRWILRRKPRMLVARPGQVDIPAAGDARLTCRVEDLDSE